MENQLFSSVLFGAISAIPTSTLGLLGSCTLEKWHHLFVDGTKYGLPEVSNFVVGDKLSCPDASGVVAIEKGYGRLKTTEYVAVMHGDEPGEVVIDVKKNRVEDPEFFAVVLESLEKTSGESIFVLDRKYFMDKNTFADLAVAYRKYFDNNIERFREIILSGRKPSELTCEQEEYVEFLLDGRREELQNNFKLCTSVKRGELDAESVIGKEFDDRPIDEVIYDPLEEIYEELKSGR